MQRKLNWLVRGVSSCLLVLMMNVVMSASSLARDLGKRGAVFKVVEEGLVAMIRRKLAALDFTEYQLKLQTLARERILYPENGASLKRAKKKRSFYYDPTYILKRDIILPNGKVVYQAGTEVNPLEQLQLERRLFFIDARDQEQVEWLGRQLLSKQQKIEDKKSGDGRQGDSGLEDRVILVGGSVLDLIKQFETGQVVAVAAEGKELKKRREQIAKQIYFDQQAELVNKFGIKQLPAIAKQEGLWLKIEEMVI